MVCADVLAVSGVPDDRPIVHPESIYDLTGRALRVASASPE
jgi:hypothetical protein